MKNSSYNETDVVKVEYRCPRCKEKTITNFKYLTSILTEKDAISNLTLLFEPNYEIKLANHLDRQNITESAKEYLSGLLKLKGIKETENGYTLNIEEIPQLRGFSNQTLKGLGIDYKELVSYLISANI